MMSNAGTIQSPSLRVHRVERFCLYLVLAVALVLRCYRLDAPMMWCDEAESSINALTILEHGYPTSTYLGLPIFENVLTEPWPENPEYEFRDSSYSKRGVAVYHGWLPLYVMAGSLRAFGIEPATDASRLVARTTPADITLRTIAPRIPSVIFGLVFLVLIYITAREMYGNDAGWAALLASAVAVPMVHAARQARYYSLTLMLSMACCLLLWRMLQRGRWRDYLGCAIAASLLFHTHVLTFIISCAAAAVLLPALLRQNGVWKKLLASSSIVLLAIVPWGIATEFFTSASIVPKAAATLHLPRDLFLYAIERWPVTLFLAMGTAWILTVHLFRNRLPARLIAPFVDARGSCAFLIAWCVIGWLAFMLLIPAASLWLPRAYLGIVGPGILLGAILFAGVGRLMRPRYSVVIGSVLFLGFIYGNARASYSWDREVEKSDRNRDLIARMRTWELRPATRVYATPSDQLILTYYTDVPVQSVAAVRRSFFENFPNDLVIIESFSRFISANWHDVQLAAKKYDIHLSRSEADSWARRLTARNFADHLGRYVASIDVPRDRLPPFAADVFRRQRELTVYYSDVTDNPVGANPAIFRGYPLPDYSWWWQIFFYRYVDVHARSGENLNYLPRLRNARAVVLPSTCVMYFSPGKQESVAGGDEK
ncbi:MAG: glycosyltransferase family 39 protein [Anaerolineae bacterium]|nr:glycosyltransferase family 39 protein [Phycisphaerae bacterium]